MKYQLVNWAKGGITMMEITKYFMGFYDINIRYDVCNISNI